MKIKLAENIKSLRKSHSLTQEQLAETLGVTVGAVYKWEAGLSTPEIKLIMEIADLFSQKQGGYGIGNVIKRLRLKYGEIVKFYFEVKDGQTICHIEIPLERRKKEDEKKEEKEDV